MAAVLRIKLADLLAVLLELPPKAQDVADPPQSNFTQLKLIGFRPGGGATKPVTPNMSPKVDEQDLRIVQKYLRHGPASREDLEFHLNMSSSMVLRRLKMLKERGVVEHRSHDNTYALQGLL